MISYHNHSEYSFLDGIKSPEAFVKRAVELGHKAFGLSEHGNMISAIPLQKACKKYNIKPIFSSEFYFVDDVQIKQRSEKRNHMIIIAKNIDGFRQMQSLTTSANIDSFYYKPRIDLTSLLKIVNLENVIITTACPGSWINNPNRDKITQTLLENRADIFVEIQPHKNEIHSVFNEYAYKYACKFDLDLIMATDSHCPNQEDTYLQDVLFANQMGKRLTDPDVRLLPRSADKDYHTYFMWSKDEILKADIGKIPYKEIEDAIENTNYLGDVCNVKIENKKIILPMPPKMVPLNKTAEDLLWDLCIVGFKERLSMDIIAAESDSSYFLGFPEDKARYELYLDRLNEEFDLISSKGFCRYFLIVDDCLKFARSKDIPVGPGRGSVAGSLISFLLNISYLDPIEHNLIFARFLNKERNDFPDIDTDFSKLRRQEVIDYLTQTYGQDHTGFVMTLSTMKAKGTIRDISRAFGVPLADVNNFAKSVPARVKESDEALKEGLDSAYGRIFASKYPKVIKHVKGALDGVKNMGVHASAFIINKADLRDGNQCTVLKDKSLKRVCGSVMDNCEDSGLLKFDVLGLATLDILHHCRRLLKIEWEDIPTDDSKVFKAISMGQTLGAFQIETSASTKVVKKIKPKNFDEIVACIALVRPGPADSGMTDMYIERKKGAKWEGMHEYYEETTKDTFGVLVYQEQILHCFVKLAGMSFSKADRIRKIIGKKRDEKAFEPYWKEFRDGCKKLNTLSEKEAEEFWEGLLKWASYGFGLAHSASYALSTYRCMWYKVNYPGEFFCAALSFASWDEKSYDIAKHRSTMLEEASLQGFKIMTPKYGESEGHVWVCKNKILYMPFDCISSVDKKADQYAKKQKKKSSMISIFDEEDVAMIQAESKAEELLIEMMCHDPDKLPSLKNQKKHLPFDLPYQKGIAISGK